jgi:hypothetical protein
MTYRRIVVTRVAAGGTLLVFITVFAGHVHSLTKDPSHVHPQGAAILASTASDTALVNNVTGEEIELPPRANPEKAQS